MKKRPKIQIKCACCEKKVYKFKHHVDFNNKHGYSTYCGNDCANKAKETGTFIICANCGKKVWRNISSLKRSKSKNYFCSKHCATIVNNTLYKTGENHPNYVAGAGSYRKKALKFYGSKCALCNYSNEIVLQVHHRDRNRKHNKMKNLIVLCPTHHWEIHLGVTKLESLS